MNKDQGVDWTRIPAPIDDGKANHLLHAIVPPVPLAATDGSLVTLAKLTGIAVVYVYPMTGRPDTPLPEEWDMIPGARGCTPQACAFRDHFAELQALHVDHLFGLSTQESVYQQEAAERLHLPYPLLSDHERAFAEALELPAFDINGTTFLKRLTLIIDAGKIVNVFYPVFPPDKNASAVIAWLKTYQR